MVGRDESGRAMETMIRVGVGSVEAEIQKAELERMFLVFFSFSVS